MRMTMSKWELFGLMATNGTPYVTLPDGRKGILSSIERESGCGTSFNAVVRVFYGDSYLSEGVKVVIKTTD